MPSPKQLFELILCPLLAFMISVNAGSTSVKYEYMGKRGPAHWSTLDPTFAACSSGRQQSPINLLQSHFYDLADSTFDAQWTKSTDSSGVETLTLTADAQRLEIGGFPSQTGAQTVTFGDRSYALTQLHVHTPSEHYVNGRFYPMEIHLVHTHADGSLLVVGIFFDIHTWPSRFLDALPRV
jgi:carbonic anhydrase